MLTTHNLRDLRDLRTDLEDKTDTYRNLAKKYGVHEVTIRRYNVEFGLNRTPIDQIALKSMKTVDALRFTTDLGRNDG